MKICTKCNATYNDENLNFCLEDGTPLVNQVFTDDVGEETVVIDNVDTTENYQNTPTNQTWEQPTQVNPKRFNTAPINQAPFAQTSGGGSKTWIWALVVIFSVAMLCGGGSLIGLAIVGSYVEDEPKIVKKAPKENLPNEKEYPLSNESGRLVKSTNFSDIKFQSNEFITASKTRSGLELKTRKGYYYVFVFNEYETNNVSTKMTVTNNNAAYSKYGYGLVVQSHPSKILSKDYSFVIRSDKRQYRIVKHNNQKETVVQNWRRSSAINKGSEPNDLEVRISDGKMKFYINGKYLRTVKDKTGYLEGVAGVYTSDDIPITFSNLEIRK